MFIIKEANLKKNNNAKVKNMKKIGFCTFMFAALKGFSYFLN